VLQCCSALYSVEVCCSVAQCGAVWRSVLSLGVGVVCRGVLQCGAGC